MDFLLAKKHFFRHVATSNLTGEQLRVLMCILSREADGYAGIWQKEISEMLGIAEPNVSRSIKALMKADILSEKVTTGVTLRAICDIILQDICILHDKCDMSRRQFLNGFICPLF